MKRKLITLLLALTTLGAWATTETNPTAVVSLVNRVCGAGASDHFTFTLDDTFNGGAEAFQLGAAGGKVTVTANTLSALTCGLNWYLNHSAHVNIAWNNLTQTVTSFPAPADTRVHASDGPYRYYLNYCTFSYSMSFWDEDRWMKEIDWMALHGVNISLQIVGVDALWYKMLTQDYGFTHTQASAWIAGPVHQAWWLMDNLSGMGGPNPAEWYTRQAALGRKIVARMVELGIEPAIPGFIGMVPECIAGSNPYTGNWTSGINCPVVINATQTAVFDGIAKNYYKRLKEIFGYSPKYYANDVMHERGNATGSQENYKTVCDNTRKAMEDYATYGNGENSTWIAQMWQSNAEQFRINALSDNHTLLLDLSSERTTYKGRYGSKEYLFCMLHNYGGNIGMYGCMQKMLDEYRSHKQTGTANGSNGTLKGVGATPEGIETNPVLYDMLFELPWYGNDINAETWLNDYATARYGVVSSDAGRAWNRLRTTVYANTSSSQQGCREPVFCARPNLNGNNASAWAGASYHWDKNEVIAAAYELLSLGSATNATNYDYDVVDFARQALTDYAHTLQMDMAGSTPYTGARFAAQSDGFLQLMRDIDTILGTIEDFRLGRWVGAARKIAETEVPSMSTPSGYTSAADWLEWNARLLLTLWRGDNVNSADGLMEYANREYQGLITGYYLPRWEYYFQNLKAGGSGLNSANLYNKVERAFVYGQTNDAAQYTAVPYGTYTAGQATGNAVATARAMMQKYFGKLKNGKYYSPNVTVAASDIKIAVKTAADLSNVFKTMTTGSSIAKFNFDMDGDGQFDAANDKDLSAWEDLEVVAVTVPARIITTDGAIITFLATIGEDLDAPRTVTVATSDATMGSVKIKGYTAKSVSNTKAVTVIATENEGHKFLFWGDAEGNVVSTMPTFNYASADPIDLIAYFGQDKWTAVSQSSAALGETRTNSAYVTSFSYKIGEGSYQEIYTANAAPESNVFCVLDNIIVANPGDNVRIKWTGGSGLTYCYMSAYYDSNADGTYDAAPFATLGTHSKQVAAVQNNEVTIQIPSSARGLTRTRLRFDGAWNGGWDANISAYPAQAETNRPVYDIYVYVVNNRTAYAVPEHNHENNNDASQYIKTISLIQDGTTTSLLNVNSWSESDHYQILTPTVDVTPGSTFTLSGTGTGLQYTYLSFFLDKNRDFYFDGEGETLGSVGHYMGTWSTAAYNKSNVDLSGSDWSIAVAIPENMPAGETTLRVRVDGGWEKVSTNNNGTWSFGSEELATYEVADLKNAGQTNLIAKYADDPSTRTVYDIKLNVLAPVPEAYEPWSQILETTTDANEGGKNHDSGAWLTSITINGTEVYANSNTDPVHTIIDAVSQVTLNPGGTYTVAWTANDEMKWARLTAYYDLDGDGTFEEATADSAGDCLGVMGGFKPNSTTGNASLPNNSFTFTLPADASIGVSCLRLRFDDAWQNPTGVSNSVTEFGSSNQVQPMLSTSRSSRNVYDVHVTIEEPQWSVAEVTIGGLVFDGMVSKNSNEAVLNEYTSGLGNNVTLTHAATSGSKEYTVADLTPVFDVLKNVNTATTVTIASDITSLGEAYPAYVPKRSAGYETPKQTIDGSYTRYDYRWDLSPVLSGDCWNLNIKARIGVKQLNAWGGAAIATGTNPTPNGANFNGGFQFYQHGANSANASNRGKLTLTSNGTQTLTNDDGTEPSLISTDVTFEFKYRNGQMALIYFTDNGQSGKKTWNNTVTSLSNLCAAFADDADILGMTYNFINEESTEPVVATTWLNNENITIQLEDGYTGTYSIDENGSLWGSARQQQLLRVPSAAQLADKNNRFTVPESMLAISPDAFLNNPTAKVNIVLQQYLMVDDLLKPGNVSLAMTETSDNEESLMNATEVTFAEVTLDRKPSASKWNTFVLPFGISGDEMDAYISDVYDFSGVKASGDNIVINFTRHTGAMEAGEPYLVKGTAAAADGLVFANKNINVSPATKTFEAGDYIVKVHGKYDRIPLQGENIYYISSDKFYRAKNEVTMKGFRAYIEVVDAQSNAPAQIALLDFSLGDIETGVDEIEVHLSPDVMYNLSGQRVYRTQGIVIRDGKKVVIK